jgi:lysosomal acid phosphatase
MLWVFVLISVSDAGILSVIEVCRHGARAPIDNYSWDQGYWRQGYGELTPEGMRQQYLNGVEFRSRYVGTDNKNTTSGPIFNFTGNYNLKEIYVRSTDVNRTIMSAQSQLLGFFPNGPQISKNLTSKAVPPLAMDFSIINTLGLDAVPNAYQPVPVHVVSAAYDNMLAGYSSKSCPYINVITQMVQQSIEYQSRVTNYTQNLQKQLFRVFGQELDFETAGWYADVLVCDKYQNYSIPAGLTDDMFQQMMGIMNYSNSYFFDYGGAYLASSQFYSQVLQTFNGVINGTDTHKWQLYSAHDTTLIGLLRAIDQWDGNNPPFASTLVFELYQDDLNSTNYGVYTRYNDAYLNIAGCPDYPNLCPISQFQSFFSWIIPNVPQACSIQGLETPQVSYNPFLERFS